MDVRVGLRSEEHTSELQSHHCISVVGIKIARRNINKLRYADDTTLMAESEEEVKNLMMKVKEESEKVGLKKKKVGLKLNI